MRRGSEEQYHRRAGTIHNSWNIVVVVNGIGFFQEKNSRVETKRPTIEVRNPKANPQFFLAVALCVRIPSDIHKTEIEKMWIDA